MNAYKSQVRIGNESKTLIAVNRKQASRVASMMTVDRLHHIHIFDRSGSMWNVMRELIANLKATVDMMSPGDLISLIWFSGQGQCGVILRGATKEEAVKAVLDSYVGTVGLTCFNEAFNEAHKVIVDLKALCPNFNVTFFTDGDSNSPYNDHDLTMSHIDAFKGSVMALNTVGYGPYGYNKELLMGMAEKTNFGKFVHFSQIGEYAGMFARTRQVLTDMIEQHVEVLVSGEIVYIGSKNTKMTRDAMTLDFVDKRKNQFMLVLDEGTENFAIDGEIFKVSDITRKIQPATLYNFYYAYASELYYMGRQDEALDILNANVHDKAAIDSLIGAFTANERAEFQKTLGRMVFNNKRRYASGYAADSYLPAEDALCGMDILNTLTHGRNFYIPVQGYQRAGLKVTDEFDLFVADPGQKVRSPFGDFVFNESQLNVSIRTCRTGKVDLNPKAAKGAGLPTSVPSKIWRNQMIVKDGGYNVPVFRAEIDQPTLGRLTSEAATTGIDFFKPLAETDAEGLTLVEIDLSKLPIINRMYAKQASNIANILEIVTDIQSNKARAKVVRYFIEKCRQADPTSFRTASEGAAVDDVQAGILRSLTADQVRVLKEHGLNEKFDYVGVDRKAASKEGADFYMSRLLKFALKGWSSPPKVEDVMEKMAIAAAPEVEGSKKKAKPLEGPWKAMAEAIEMCRVRQWDVPSAASKTGLERILGRIKDETNNLSVELSTLRIAKVVTGGWWEGLNLNPKNGDYEYVGGNGTLIVKNDRVQKFFTASGDEDETENAA